MPDPAGQPTLLEELDERQDEVLTQLDDLNARIEKLLEEYTQVRSQEMQATSS